MSAIREREIRNKRSSATDDFIKSPVKDKMPRGITNGQREGYRLTTVSIDLLRCGIFSARRSISAMDASISELAESIATSGMIEPIVVRESDFGEFEVVAGERRLMAAKLRGLQSVPCLVMKCSAGEAFMISLTENLQRIDLNPIEKAQGLARLLNDFDLTQEEVGRRVGISQSSIAHYLRLLTLPAHIQTLMERGELSMGHGKVLAGIRDEERILDLARQCVAQEKSVRELEKALRETEEKDARGEAGMTCKTRRQAHELPNGVFLVVKEDPNHPNSGKIEIPYYSDEEKQWLFVVLSRGTGAR